MYKGDLLKKLILLNAFQLFADVEVIHAVPAVGHLSSSSIFPACFAPYAIVTACSDHTIRSVPRIFMLKSTTEFNVRSSVTQMLK